MLCDGMFPVCLWLCQGRIIVRSVRMISVHFTRDASKQKPTSPRREPNRTDLGDSLMHSGESTILDSESVGTAFWHDAGRQVHPGRTAAYWAA